MQRILIDGRFIGVGESISRYTLEILKGILELDRENQYTLLVRPQGEKIAKQFFGQSSVAGRQSPVVRRQTTNVKIEVLDIPHYSFAEQTKLLKYLNGEKFDLVHFTQFNHPIRYRGNFVVSIHDLTLFGHLYRKEYLERIGFRLAMNSAVKNSKKIITISETTKKDLLENYKIEPEKIAVIYLGVDERYNSNLKSQNSKLRKFKDKYNILDNYFLYTGMWKRHKNLLRMLEAFEKFISYQISVVGNSQKTENRKQKTEITQLVLVGKIDKEEPEVLNLIDKINTEILNMTSTDFVHRKGTENAIATLSIAKGKQSNNQVIEHLNNKPIICTGFVEEEELPIAYAGALAYIMPSLSEGFGLPPLEAMACGTPVISSNVSAMPEILGDAPLYFDPYNIEDIAKAMEKIVTDENLRQELSKRGILQAKKYGWKRTAQKTLELYKKII